MSVLSGKNGTITVDPDSGGSPLEETPVTNWKASFTSNNPDYAANDTGGAKKRVAGVKDSSGSFEMADTPTLIEGQKASLAMYTIEDIFTLPIIVDTVDLDVDVNDGAIINQVVSWSADGAVVRSTGSLAGQG